MKSMLFVAGRSGGHVVPLITLAQQISHELSIFVTTHTPLDYEIMKQADRAHVHYSCRLDDVPRRFWHWVFYLFQLTGILSRILYIFIKHRPAAIYTTGSYISVPVTLVACVFRVPIHIYHLDVIPGKANDFIHRYAQHAYLITAQTSSYLPASRATIHQTRYPLRFSSEDRISKQRARDILGIEYQQKVILILGGSQGSTSITALVQEAILKLSSIGTQEINNLFFLHQAGIKEQAAVQDWYKKHAIKALVFGYISSLAPYYCAADNIVSRAGAGSLAEIVFFQVPALILPLHGIAQNHQVINAQEYTSMYPEIIKAVLSEDKNNLLASISNILKKE